MDYAKLSKGVITDYQIVPQSGGGVCVIGILNGRQWQTTRLARVADDGSPFVMTKSDSVYELRAPKPGLWGTALQMHRPDEFEKVKHLV